jgi:lysozyme
MGHKMKKAIEIIKEFEGCKLKAYLCPAGIPTIGFGNTYYNNGKVVKIGDTITQSEADMLLTLTVRIFYDKVIKAVKSNINENQIAALTSFAYNVGVGAFEKSTLLKKVNANPDDPTIEAEFMKWTKAAGIVLNGLKKRRMSEYKLYTL